LQVEIRIALVKLHIGHFAVAQLLHIRLLVIADGLVEVFAPEIIFTEMKAHHLHPRHIVLDVDKLRAASAAVGSFC